MRIGLKKIALPQIRMTYLQKYILFYEFRIHLCVCCTILHISVQITAQITPIIGFNYKI